METGMGAILLMLMLFGCWLVLAAVMDWDWCLGPIELDAAIILFGNDTVRWCLGGVGGMMVLFALLAR